MENFRKSRLRKGISIVAALMLLLGSITTAYTVTYYANGGTPNSVSEDVKYNSGYTFTGGDIFSKVGYLFSGWSTTTAGAVEYTSGQNITWATTTGLDLYVIWTPIKYTIQYEPGTGAAGTAQPVFPYIYDDLEALIAGPFTEFIYTGYEFSGWSISGVDYVAGISKVFNLADTQGATVIATATWKPLSYTVTYYANDGTLSSASEDAIYDSGYTFTGDIFPRTGYTFSGWSTTTAGAVEYTSGQNITWATTTGLDLYAIWTENNYVVEFTGGAGAEGSTGTLNLSYTDEFDLPDNDAFTKTGYIFSGWNFGGTSYATGTTLSGLVAENGGTGTFTAEWTAETYTVTYKANGGLGTDVTENVTYSGSYTFTGSIFSREGYTFSGWNTQSDGSGDYKSGSETWSLTSGLDLYAIWIQNPAEITPTGGSSGGGGRTNKDDSKVTTGTNAEVNTGDNVDVNTGDNNDNIDNNLDDNEGNNGDNNGNAQVYDQELINAYKWAHALGITTMPTIEEAMLYDGITREQLAKMMVVFMSKVLGKQPIRTRKPIYRDVSVKKRGQEMNDYITLAYQYQIMGIDAKGRQLRFFNPEGKVTRAEFATVLSRVLYGSKYNSTKAKYREKHIKALEASGILTNTNPNLQELRGYIILMFYRSQGGDAVFADQLASDEDASHNKTSDDLNNESSDETESDESSDTVVSDEVASDETSTMNEETQSE